MLVAGEASGDDLGAPLMRALRAASGGSVEFCGIGGEAMAAEGLTSLLPMSDLSVMGLAEILPRARTLLGHISRTAEFARKERPDILVTIDSPGFNFRLAKRLAGQGMPIVHYVAPSVWAWRPGRAKKIAPLFDHLLALLPFEPPYFERHGLACTFVGHGVTEHKIAEGSGAAFRSRVGIAGDAQVVVVLPGSRRTETTRLLPAFGGSVSRLAREIPGLRVVVPTVAGVADQVRQAAQGWAGDPVIVSGTQDRAAAFAASNVALAASGTVTLELALAGVPMVVAYRMNPLTNAIVRSLASIKYPSLINIILDRPAIPELLQGDCEPEGLTRAVMNLVTDADARARQIEDAGEAMKELGVGGRRPSERAADVILEVMRTAAV
jgi:lipid-A-disaccharide synthase